MDAGSGMRNVAGVLMGLGSQVAEYAITTRDVSEISKARAKYNQHIAEYEMWMDENSDNPGDYIDEFQRRKDIITKDIFDIAKTPGAKNRMEAELDIRLSDYDRYVQRVAQQREDANAEANYKVNMANTTAPPAEGEIWTGEAGEKKIKERLLDAELNTQDMLDAKRRTEKEKKFELTNAQKEIISYWVLQQADLETDTEKFFSTINTTIKDKFGVSGLLSTEDVAELKRQYQRQKQLQEYESKTAREQKENETLNLAFDFAEKGDFRGGINEITNARAELGSDSFVDALNKYQNAFRILNTTGHNVYKETQNWELYWQDYQKAIDDNISELEARNHVGVNGYSVTQFKEIKGIIDGTSSKGKGFEDTKAAKDLIEMIDYNFNLVIGGLEEQKYLHNKGLKLLKEAITEDMNNDDKLLEAVRISRELKKEFESGKTLEELEQGLTMGAATGLGDIWNKLDSDDRKRALDALARGVTAQQIIDLYNRNTK